MFYREKERDIPVAGEYGVIVCGSGPAGLCAAVKAGRMGVKTLIIEYNNSVGGMSTSGLMSHWTGSVTSRMYAEILSRMADANEGLRDGVNVDKSLSLDAQVSAITEYIDVRS